MASKDKKASKPSRTRNVVRTLSDLNRPSADSDSDSDGPQEYYTGGEKSGMIVQDPSKDDTVQAIFDQAKLSEAMEGPAPEPSSSRSFAGTHRLLFGESAQSAPQQPENIVHNISFWTNGFTVGEGPLRRFDNPENASFLESIKNSRCPEELEPTDKRSSVYVSLTRRNENCPEPETRPVPFQGMGRTLAGSSVSSMALGATSASNQNASPTAIVAVDETMPQTSIQIRLADGSRLIGKFNHHHTINDLRSFIDGSQPEAPRNYLLQITGFPPVILGDPTQTIEQAGLANSVVIQKF